MKSFLKSFFTNREYIGLSEFKSNKRKMPPVKKELANSVEKTALTGLIRRVG